MRVLEVLENADVPCCVLHGYAQSAEQDYSPVECLIPAIFLPKPLAEVLHTYRDEIGARVVQWVDENSHFIVLAGKSDDGLPIFLKLRVSSRYEAAGRIFFESDVVMKTRRRREGFWSPAPEIEFAWVLSTRLAERKLTDQHGQRLSDLYSLDPMAAEQHIARLLKPDSAKMVVDAARRRKWLPVQQAISPLRQEILNGKDIGRAGRRIPRLAVKISRWLWPDNGFHAIFLGPDGIGKSTTAQAFERDMAPAFRRNTRCSFRAPELAGRTRPLYFLSFVRAVFWFYECTFGYILRERPTLVLAGLVVSDRSLVDVIIDPCRYGYRGPSWLLKAIWAVARKPNLVILLDAAPEIIQQRIKDIPFRETVRQVQAYRSVVTSLPGAKVVDALVSAEELAANVNWLVIGWLANRVCEQFRLNETS